MAIDGPHIHSLRNYCRWRAKAGAVLAHVILQYAHVEWSSPGLLITVAVSKSAGSCGGRNATAYDLCQPILLSCHDCTSTSAVSHRLSTEISRYALPWQSCSVIIDIILGYPAGNTNTLIVALKTHWNTLFQNYKCIQHTSTIFFFQLAFLLISLGWSSSPACNALIHCKLH